MAVEWQGKMSKIWNRIWNLLTTHLLITQRLKSLRITIWLKKIKFTLSPFFVSGKILTPSSMWEWSQGRQWPFKVQSPFVFVAYFVQYQKLKSYFDSLLCFSVEFNLFCHSCFPTVSGFPSLIMTFLVDPGSLFMFLWYGVMMFPWSAVPEELMLPCHSAVSFSWISH